MTAFSPSLPAVGSVVVLSIDRLTVGGDGVGRLGPFVVFVPYACPGDRLEVEITERQARFSRARIRNILSPGADRIAPRCPYHFQAPPEHQTQPEGWCGGCSWQHLRYSAQLETKHRLVQETLERVGGLKNISVQPALGMERAPDGPWRYRNKAQQPVAWSAARRQIVTGFYAPYSHSLVPIADCLVQPKASVELFNAARDLLDRFKAPAYDEDAGRGWIRHLLLRSSHATGQALLVFVTRNDAFPHAAEYVQQLTRRFPFLSGIHQNVNTGRTNVILGREWKTLWGEDHIEECLGKLRFRLSAGSFFQVNSLQAEALYEAIRESLPGTGGTLLDLYCGVGGIALTLADRFKHVIGVDEVMSAVRDAGINADLNGIRHVEFHAQSAEKFLRRRFPGGSDLTMVLDPPRAGCAPAVLQAVNAVRPRRLVYVSCDPATLARDLKLLVGKGFRIGRVQPVDLFPQTPHIETVVTMTFHG